MTKRGGMPEHEALATVSNTAEDMMLSEPSGLRNNEGIDSAKVSTGAEDTVRSEVIDVHNENKNENGKAEKQISTESVGKLATQSKSKAKTDEKLETQRNQNGPPPTCEPNLKKNKTETEPAEKSENAIFETQPNVVAAIGASSQQKMESRPIRMGGRIGRSIFHSKLVNIEPKTDTSKRKIEEEKSIVENAQPPTLDNQVEAQMPTHQPPKVRKVIFEAFNIGADSDADEPIENANALPNEPLVDSMLLD